MGSYSSMSEWIWEERWERRWKRESGEKGIYVVARERGFRGGGDEDGRVYIRDVILRIDY